MSVIFWMFFAPVIIILIIGPLIKFSTGFHAGVRSQRAIYKLYSAFYMERCQTYGEAPPPSRLL